MKYYIIAGEASGDLHGSNLMRGLYEEDPAAEIRFWGGGMMNGVYRSHNSADGLPAEAEGRSAATEAAAEGSSAEAAEGRSAAAEAEGSSAAAGRGCGLVKDYGEGAVMGVADVLAKAGRLLGNLRFCKEDILSWKPDAVILIDYPGFNMKIAKFAHKAGFKVFYYIAPKTWASREGRNRKLRQWVDRLFIVFPFEIPYFESKAIPFTYVGNPLIDAIDGSRAMSESREDFLNRHSLADRPFIALLAGSRKSEVRRTLSKQLEMADRLHETARYREHIFLVAGAPSRSESDYLDEIGKRDYVRLIFDDSYGILRNSESAVINSGTASLEAALIGTPQVVVWSTSGFNAFIGKYILRVLDHIRFISLGNLIADRLVFPELIQEDFTVENICAETRALNEHAEYREAMLRGYDEIRSALGGAGASRKVAKAMIDCCSEGRQA